MTLKFYTFAVIHVRITCAPAVRLRKCKKMRKISKPFLYFRVLIFSSSRAGEILFEFKVYFFATLGARGVGSKIFKVCDKIVKCDCT